MKNTKTKVVFRLLCCLFMAMFLLRIGGGDVLAENAPNTIKVSKGETWIYGSWPAYVKTANVNGRDVYAFCLNSAGNIPGANQSISLDSNLHKDKQGAVAAVVGKAMEYGLGNGNSSHTITINSNSYTVSEKDLYAVTQIAVWHILYGDGENGSIARYRNWIDDHGLRNVYEDLLKTTVNSQKYSASLIANGNSKLVLDGEYLVSSATFKIDSNAPSSVTYTLSVTNGEVQINSGEWTSSNVQVTKNDTIKVRTSKPTTGEGEKTVSLSFTSSEFISGYSAYFYKANANQQNIGIVLPNTIILSGEANATGNYTNDTIVKVEKRDADTNQKVSGATIGIYKKSNNQLITSVKSTGQGETNPEISLPTGEYYIKEIYAPTGYSLNESSVNFSIASDAGTLKVYYEDGSVSDTATIAVQDKPQRFRFRKVDFEGNPVSGVNILVVNYIEHDIFEHDGGIICAKTDANGYLTQPCDASIKNGVGSIVDGINQINVSNLYNSNGLYPAFTGFYYIIEEFKDNYYDADFTDDLTDFGFVKGDMISVTQNIEFGFDEMSTYDVIDVKIKNDKYISISKTEIGGSSEIPGAKMHLYSKDTKDFYVTENPEDAYYQELQSWTSTTEPKKIYGIIPDAHYILSEEIAPEGHVRITTDIEFSMDINGNVTVYSDNASVNTDSYKLVVGNDYTKVKISKTDMVTGDEVPGAHIKLCTSANYQDMGMDCEAYTEWDSTSEGHEIDRLPVGDYYLIETIAPAGYIKKTSAVPFTVSEKSEQQPVEFKNEPTKVTISKLNQKTGEKVAGSYLQILNSSDRSIVNLNGNELAWVSDGINDWTIYALPAGEYILTETKVPEGYQEGMVIDGQTLNEFKFTVSDLESDVNVDVPIVVYNVPNTAITLLNLFAIGGLFIFTGYEIIKVYRRKSVN